MKFATSTPSIGDVDILRGLDLSVEAGQIHAVMGPNGSGKSTLANVLAGNPQYTVTQGEILFQGQDLLAMTPEDRARAGVFLSFQHPVEIPGVRLDHFMRGAYNAIRKSPRRRRDGRPEVRPYAPAPP